MTRMTVLDPRAGADVSEQLAERISSLNGARVGLLWNNRPAGDKVLRGIAHRLENDFGCSTVFQRKMRVGSGAPAEEIRKLEKEVEAVILGVGD